MQNIKRPPLVVETSFKVPAGAILRHRQILDCRTRLATSHSQPHIRALLSSPPDTMASSRDVKDIMGVAGSTGAAPVAPQPKKPKPVATKRLSTVAITRGMTSH